MKDLLWFVKALWVFGGDKGTITFKHATFSTTHILQHNWDQITICNAWKPTHYQSITESVVVCEKLHDYLVADASIHHYFQSWWVHIPHTDTKTIDCAIPQISQLSLSAALITIKVSYLDDWLLSTVKTWNNRWLGLAKSLLNFSLCNTQSK